MVALPNRTPLYDVQDFMPDNAQTLDWTDPKRAGLLMRVTRERLGISKEELGDRLSAHPSPRTIGKWERGENTPRASARFQIAEILGMRDAETAILEGDLISPISPTSGDMRMQAEAYLLEIIDTATKALQDLRRHRNG